MNFDELYQKYKDGTASKQEIAVVEAEIEKSKRVLSLIEGGEAADIVIEPADSETVQKAKKAFNIKSTIKTVVIAVICIVIVAVLALGGFFGTAYISANRSKTLTEEQATEAAKTLLTEHIEGIEAKDIIVSEAETELDIGSRLTDSVFVYEISLICLDYQYEIDVSSKTGYAVISDKESINEQHSKNRYDEHKSDSSKADETSSKYQTDKD